MPAESWCLAAPSWLHPRDQSTARTAPLPLALTETMISATVWLDILESPNVLMLKALIFSVVATCSRRAATSSDSTGFEDAILRAEGQGRAQPPWLGGRFGTDNGGDWGTPTGHTGFAGRCLFPSEPPGPTSSHPAPASCGVSSRRSLLELGWAAREARADHSPAKEQTPFHGDAEQSPPHSPCSAWTSLLAQDGWQRPETPRSFGLRLSHPFPAPRWEPRISHSSCAGTEQGIPPPAPRSPPSPPGASSAAPQHCPCPILAQLGSPGTPRQGSAPAPTHGERHWGSISRGARLLGVTFHRRVGSEPCPEPWCDGLSGPANAQTPDVGSSSLSRSLLFLPRQLL